MRVHKKHIKEGECKHTSVFFLFSFWSEFEPPEMALDFEAELRKAPAQDLWIESSEQGTNPSLGFVPFLALFCFTHCSTGMQCQYVSILEILP